MAVLETMWDWRGLTTGAGYIEAPRWFTINPKNHSGRRLYRLVGSEPRLVVTNACRELVTHASKHGRGDPTWLRGNLERLEPFALLLPCGRVAQRTLRESGYVSPAPVIEIMHPAARTWTIRGIEEAALQIRAAIATSQEKSHHPTEHVQAIATRT